ncbi:prominin-like protein isoform X2 [Tribolium madens]|uniref:prominin-like protein isoform X2 n=1 Tax=Tribolium madens TaxID=41895 RepID=UPI001CF7444F|nr:prominin-like protein isoform X2 [Tribolium madens]
MVFISDRQKINLVNLLVTFGVLFVAVDISSGSFATRINKISENLDKALSQVIHQTPDYTNLTDDATYVSDAYFNPRGMEGLYNFTNAFMELIFSKEIYPEGFIRIENNQILIGDIEKEWKSLLTKYVGLLVMVIILALIIVFMPFCGLCFCCCRCCGKCGARSQPFDKKHDFCKKFILATVLIGLGTCLLFGVVCAFVSNQQMEEGIGDLPQNLRKGVTDVDTYLDTTKKQIETLLKKNYGEFESVLTKMIDNSTAAVYGELVNYSNAISMTEVANIVEALPAIEEKFITLKYSTNTLRVYASQLNDAVRKVKKDMLSILQLPGCEHVSKCSEISRNISSLQTNIHFNNLPDITDKIAKLDEITKNQTLIEAVRKGKNALEDIKVKIGDKVNATLDKAHEKINEAGVQIRHGADNVTQVITDLKAKIDSNTNPVLDTSERYIKQYSFYRYYAALVISCLLLLITIFITLGLVCGICGKRPEGYGDDCCNKGAGSQFLICGVLFMFLAGFVIAIVVLALFMVGVVTQRVVCDPMRDPANSQIFDLIDSLNFSDYGINITVSEALEKCYQNKSIYEVANLADKFNLAEVKNYLNSFGINQTLAGLDIGSLDLLNDFKLLSDDDKKLLESFADSGFAEINFDEFKDLLSTNFTTVNLTDLANEVGDLIKQLEPKPEAADLVEGLQVSKMNIEMYEEKIVEPMIKNASAVIDLAKVIEKDLRLNHSSFSDAMRALLDELTQAENTLIYNGTDFLNTTVIEFTTGIVNLVQTYIDRVVTKTETEVGQCGPLSMVIHATMTSTCDKILTPWNGYWFGLFWSLVLFIPTIIVSVKLATLYQKHSPYSRDLVEAEYLYDAYVDRDNIPLNRNGKAKKKNKKHKRYEDRPIPSAGGDMVVREYAAGSNPDARYADMAPKQWEDFPAGGPPQYQRAPTEYERPPPYYYPGAGENAQ